MMVFSEWWKTSRPARKPVLMVVATIPYAVGFSTAYTVAQTNGMSIDMFIR